MTTFLELMGWRRTDNAVAIYRQSRWRLASFAVLAGAIAVGLFRLL
jgi:hypothetical protein